jgi:hypothetical protein
MKCERHPEFEVKNIFGECQKCADEEQEDYKKLKESVSESLRKSGILKIKTGDIPE